MAQFFNRQGEPILQTEWWLLFQRIDYRIVKEDVICGGLGCISTLWLGFDSRLFGDPERLTLCSDGTGWIFETVIALPGDIRTYRQKTEEESLRFHRYMVGTFEEAEEHRKKRGRVRRVN